MMITRFGILFLSLMLVASLVGVAQADRTPGPGPAAHFGSGHPSEGHPATMGGWNMILYFGGEDIDDIEWYYNWLISSGIGVGCGFIGLGIGTLNPFAGFFVSAGCESVIMA